MRKGGELKTYLKVIALILFVVPLLVMSTPTAYAFPQNNHHYKFTGITYDPVSFKKIGDAKVNLKHAGQILHVNVILNDVKYTATIPTSKLLVFSNNKLTIKHFTGNMIREDRENFYGTIYLELDSYNKFKAITGIINDYSACKNGIGFIALEETGSCEEIKLPTPTNGKTYQSKALTATSDPQPGDKGWLGYGDNGQINGGAVGTYDDQTNKLGGIEAGEVATVWFPVWIDPYYRVGDIPSMAKLTYLHAKVWAGDWHIDFGSPTPDDSASPVSYSFTVTVGYGGVSCSVTVSYDPHKVKVVIGREYNNIAYIEWKYINLNQRQGFWGDIFPDWPYMDDHRSSDSAFGMLSAWVHPVPGTPEGWYTCYIKFKFDWLAYMVGWQRGYWVSGSTDWLVVSFQLYVYW